MNVVPPKASAPTVFVVDDDSSTRELIGWLMKRNGIEAQLFADARAFLRVYRADVPGCLVLDLNMPGMNGLELQQYLNEQGVVLPVIFLSGRADVPKAVRAVREGAIDFLEKPFDYKQLVALVQKCFERDAARRAERARQRALADRLAQLTQREREVLERV
ncbi:MAG TPA: response regulator, partial [Usitatibacter sp.]|nr:response regulator [Usitatibacter sp.]